MLATQSLEWPLTLASPRDRLDSDFGEQIGTVETMWGKLSNVKRASRSLAKTGLLED